MSTFSKALEQAERDRAQRRTAAADGAPTAPPSTSDSARAGSPDVTQGPPRDRSAVVTDPRPARAQVAPPAVPTALDLEEVDEHLVSLLAPTSVAAEHYRTLRYLVEALPRAGRGLVVGVTSADRGDGKTTTAMNLSGTLAQASNARVLLVDADLRAPAVGTRLALDPADTRGLAYAISRPDVPLERVVRGRPPFNLAVLPAGPPPTSPYEALRSGRLGELLEEAREQFDYVILDTPPLVPVPDCRVLEPWVDAFLLVVAAHRSPRTLLEEALMLLPPSKVLGIVFNMDDTERRYYRYSPYGVSHNGARARRGRWLARRRD